MDIHGMSTGSETDIQRTSPRPGMDGRRNGRLDGRRTSGGCLGVAQSFCFYKCYVPYSSTSIVGVHITCLCQDWNFIPVMLVGGWNFTGMLHFLSCFPLSLVCWCSFWSSASLTNQLVEVLNCSCCFSNIAPRTWISKTKETCTNSSAYFGANDCR